MKKRKNFLISNLYNSLNKTSKGTILRSVAVFIAIEFCGSILTGRTGNGTTRLNFKEFCESKYLSKKYHRVSDLLYLIFRNGVAHSYLAKGGALLTSSKNAINGHFKFLNSGLLIYVPVFAQDVQVAIKKLYKDIKTNKNNLRINYEKIIQDLHNTGMKFYKDYIKRNKIRPRNIPVRGDMIINIL